MCTKKINNDGINYKIPELAVSIIYASAVSYMLIILVEKLPDDLLWMSFSSIIVFISIFVFVLIHDMQIKEDWNLFFKIVVISVATLTLFSFSRLMNLYFDENLTISIDNLSFNVLILSFNCVPLIIKGIFDYKKTGKSTLLIVGSAIAVLSIVLLSIVYLINLSSKGAIQ